MKKYYLSHPYTGNEAENIASARRKKVKLQASCIFLLKDCDAMILCDGWQDSKGCQEEYAYAKDNGIRVIPFSKCTMGI